MSNSLQLRAEYLCFNGTVAYYSHYSQCCHHQMNFAVYLPPQAKFKSVPILYYLSGLTCTEENFITKAGAQQYAAEYGIMLVVPDTSPRQTGIRGENDTWDLGSGASFYVNATQEPWCQYYQMYSYIVEELPQLIKTNFPVQTDQQGIFGHSMGGHGALVCALRNPDKYLSVSAFAPIVAPMSCPWGKKAFTNYLGEDTNTWREYDASELIQKHQFSETILIDQGSADSFLAEQQLLPEVFINACERVNQPLNLRFQEGYDHSYFMIATFMKDHLFHHANILGR